MYFPKFLDQSSHLDLVKVYMSCEGAEFALGGNKNGFMEEVLAEKILFGWQIPKTSWRDCYTLSSAPQGPLGFMP